MNIHLEAGIAPLVQIDSMGALWFGGAGPVDHQVIALRIDLGTIPLEPMSLLQRDDLIPQHIIPRFERFRNRDVPGVVLLEHIVDGPSIGTNQSLFGNLDPLQLIHIDRLAGSVAVRNVIQNPPEMVHRPGPPDLERAAGRDIEAGLSVGSVIATVDDGGVHQLGCHE